jgi:D-alanyl-D-alanine carboxypeptidase
MAAWQARRPFVRASAAGCPQPPPEAGLAVVPARDAYGGKSLLLRPAAMGAYERMLEAARSDLPQLRRDRALMTVFSAYRSPEADALRCAVEGNCQNLVRTTCSAHLTGLAVDLYLGAAPGFGPASSSDENRRFIAAGAPYRWLVANADRFGFVPYPFEPWHWEWTGEPS